MPVSTRGRSRSDEDPEDTPRKRQKVESDDEGALQVLAEPTGIVERCEELWFEEGNVVVAARDLAFKVHTGILGRHSDIFKGFFIPVSLAQLPKGRDGCHILRVDDAGSALKELFNVIYDGGNSKWFNSSKPPIQYAEFRSVVAVAVKYEVKEVLTEARSRLSRLLPTENMGDWDANLRPDGEKTSIRMEQLDRADLPRMVRVLGMQRELAIALYACCCTRDLSFIADGVRYGDETVRLSDADMLRFVRGRTALALESSRIAKTFLQFGRGSLHEPAGCKECRPAFQYLGIAAVVSGFFCTPSALGPYGPWLTRMAAQPHSKLCKACDTAVQGVIDQRREQAWQKLGTIFDVPNWPPGQPKNNSDIAAPAAPGALAASQTA
ncbi:hypothetical protein PsYK624_046440 [Phanerochaete sordida]|uniref:BTB domain-containing protein n=1 Tax=Phanerochaete sordida TaxID=48140 RepID=A0A9P3G5E0_9APHY|nr:hypothetical protein PsYK624_046440 [Phanerochaete sordida]